MEDYNTCHNNDMGKDSLEQLSGSCNPPDDLCKGRSSESLCKEEHSYQQNQYPVFEQVSYDEDAKLHAVVSNDLGQQEVSRKPSTDQTESPIPNQALSPKILPESPLPSSKFCWYAPDIDLFALYYQDSYTHICIQAFHDGTYLVIIRGHILVEATTLSQAQSICHAIAWIFKDSLPVPKR